MFLPSYSIPICPTVIEVITHIYMDTPAYLSTFKQLTRSHTSGLEVYTV